MRVQHIGDATLHLGDCLDVLRTLPNGSVDAVVTDPPYGLSFMGRKWDYDVPSVDLWAECLRVLKPGGHLLAFAGTRTQHRMAVRIEDAGFEIRDMIAWVYGSGFPKSMDVSKAIDKAAGAERKVVGTKIGLPGYSLAADKGRGVACVAHGDSEKECSITAPATDAARQWQGWGTALKPALETVTLASKPYTTEQEQGIIHSNLIRLEVRLWLLSSVSAAEKSSASNQGEFGAACAIAQWSAGDVTSTRAALCDQMGMSLFESATTTSLNIVSSWRRTLEESWSDGNTSTTVTRSNTTIDWKTLKFSLSQITPGTIIKACSLPGGFSVNATIAETHFNASLSLLQSTQILSATAPAMSQEQHEHQDVDVRPNLDPCIVARKPLSGTVAENVLAHGTGALNIDGCRVGAGELVPGGGRSKRGKSGGGIYGNGEAQIPAQPHIQGRWPANLIHDGSEEVTGLLGEAARFFYTPKASKNERDAGCDGLEVKQCVGGGGLGNPVSGAYGSEKAPARNHHPTVKPTDLMRYLCRLVTPPGGVVLDPFMGSGSTGMAALQQGFRFIGIEREPEYFEIALRRIDGACRQSLLPLNESRDDYATVSLAFEAA